MEFNDSPDDNRDFPDWVLLNKSKIPCYVFKFLPHSVAPGRKTFDAFSEWNLRFQILAALCVNGVLVWVRLLWSSRSSSTCKITSLHRILLVLVFGETDRGSGSPNNKVMQLSWLFSLALLET